MDTACDSCGRNVWMQANYETSGEHEMICGSCYLRKCFDCGKIAHPKSNIRMGCDCRDECPCCGAYIAHECNRLDADSEPKHTMPSLVRQCHVCGIGDMVYRSIHHYECERDGCTGYRGDRCEPNTKTRDSGDSYHEFAGELL